MCIDICVCVQFQAEKSYMFQAEYCSLLWCIDPFSGCDFAFVGLKFRPRGWAPVFKDQAPCVGRGDHSHWFRLPRNCPKIEAIRPVVELLGGLGSCLGLSRCRCS